MRFVTLLAPLTLVAVLSACGPSPEEVCDKTISLAKGAGMAATELPDRTACIKDEERAKEMKGMMKYKSSRACVMAAKTAADLAACK
jgi:hypothetical protein